MFTTKLIITQIQKLKVNLVTFQVCSNGTYLRNSLPNLSLFLLNFFLAETIFKIGSLNLFNPLSAKFIKWSNTLKQFVGKLPTNCLSVFDHFAGLALKGLIWNLRFVTVKY